jgi:hypothetical protein
LHKTLDDAINGSDKQSTALAQNAQAHASTASAVLANVAAQERAAGATNSATGAYIQQMVRLSETSAAVEVAISASQKLLQAKQDEGKAMVSAAQLTGDAGKALDAQATSTLNNAAASQAVVEARQREVTVTQAGIAAIDAQRDATGRLSTAKQVQLDKINLVLTSQAADLQQARESTLELGRQALAAQAAAEAYADNATKVDAYRQAMENSRVVAAVLSD